MRQSYAWRPGQSVYAALAVVAVLLASALWAGAATNLSAWAYPGSSGRILQQPDALGNRVLDYSGVGYKGGTVPIPEVTVKTNVAPGAGDDTARIQGAINHVKTLPLDANGFRGAVLLSAGEYQIASSITIDASGIVLRGVGEGSDTNSNTVLRSTGTSQSTLIVVSGSGSASKGTARSITNNYVPVGARSFNVSSTAGLSVGSRVFVHRPSTAEWITNIGMHLLEFPWTAGSEDLDMDRTITRMEGSRITLDTPITCALESQYGGGTIQTYTWSGRITNVGVEYLRGVSNFDPLIQTNTGASGNYYSDENHGWIFIGLDTVENAWVRNVTDQYFGYACVSASSGTRNLTVRDCTSLDPVSIITGSRRYAFVLNDSQFCLIQNCSTRNDRHQFVTQSLTVGPNVFVDGVSTNAYNDAGPHFLWGTGAIWDNVTVLGDNINVQNRGNAGTQHGWAGANEVIWNAKADGYIVQNPPGARNWLIGSVGTIQNGTMYVGPHDPGTYDSHGTNVFPNSLYYAQLQDRLAAPNLVTREIWIGDLDQFTTGSPTGDVVQVDFTWRTNVQAAAGVDVVNGFDFVASNQWVPLTFSNTLAANERIVGASLALAMRANDASATNAVLHLDSLANSNSFASLGWLPIGTGTNTTVRTLDLGGQINLLNDGQLNLAVQDDVGMDWALLEIHVATNFVCFTNSLPPVADSFVRGGTFSGDNYGDSTVLTVKQDSSADVQRRAYLRWDLSGVTNQILHARVRLTPTGVGTNALQNGVTLATTNAWNETSLTWSNQPGGGKRFATWIPTADEPLEFVVTPQVQAAASGDRLLALQVFSLSSVGGPGLVNYASREDASPARRPQLILVLAGSPTNTAPTTSGLTNRTISADTTTGPIGLTVQDAQSAPQNLSLSATSSNTTLVPTASIIFGGSGSNRTVTVTPAPGQTGSSLLTITVTDPGGLSTNTAFTLTVTTTNVSLLATNDSYSVNEDTALVVSAPGILANDTNTNGGSFFAVLLDSPTNGLLTLNTNGSFTYLPATNFFGNDSYTYRLTDGVITASVATVSLTVLSVNDAPVAANDNHSTVEDMPLIVVAPGVLANDTDVETNALSALLVVGPTNGALTLNSNGGFTYTPATNYFGDDGFTYVATDGAATSAVATVSLTITAAPALPASGSWAVDAGGLWSHGSNWSGGAIANAADQSATFAVDVTAARFVNLDTARTLGSLSFADANTNTAGAWIITNSPLTLQVSSGVPVIAATNCVATLALILSGASGFTKVGAGTLVLAGANDYTGATTVNDGALRVAHALGLGAVASGTAINNGTAARLELSGDVTVTEPLTLACKASAAGNVPAVVNVAGTNTLAGTINLTTGGSFWTFEPTGGKLFITGTTTNSTTTNVRTIWLRGTAEGEWRSAIANSAADLGTAVRKDDAGTWTLSGTNIYTGNTVVSNGTLLVNGTITGGAVTVVGGVLGGTGTITAPVTVAAGAKFVPGASIGTLSLSNTLTLSSGSATMVEINAETLAHDSVPGLTSVNFGGTLMVSNVAGTLAGGQSYPLFSAASSTNNFSSISPATPGPNLVWNFNPTNGTLSVISTVVTPPQFTNFTLGAGGSFTLSGTGPAGAAYRIFAATNLALPFSNWTAMITGTFGGGVFSFTDQTTNHPQRFYRAVTP